MKSAIFECMTPTALLFRIGLSRPHVVRIGTVFVKIVLLNGLAAAAPQSTLQFALPGGAEIVYSNAVNPHDPLPERSWKNAVFYFPNGMGFDLLQKTDESNADGSTQMEPPSEGNISPSGQYVVVARGEQGTVSTGPGQPESVLSREYCSMIEIRTGCITADQTGEICGAGWQDGRPAQWGTDEQTYMMVKRDRPSVSRQLGFIGTGHPPELTIRDAAGADNLLRCDPLSSANRESYRKIAAALHAAGAESDARLIDVELSKTNGGAVRASRSTTAATEHRIATVSVQKATLYTAPDETNASRAYLIQNDVVTVLKQSPVGWVYVDYVNASGKHLLRWVKADQLAIKQ